MPESLTHMWSLIDVRQPLLTADDMGRLGDEQRDALESLGFLVPAATAAHIVCSECHDDHIVEVNRVRKGEKTRFFIICPDAGWCEVSGDRLRQWSIDCEAVAKALKDALAPSGRRKAILPGRLWRLGTTAWQHTSRDVLFARGLLWPDAGDVARAVAKTTRPIVLVPDQIPNEDCWVRGIPPVVALSQVSQLCDGKLAITISELFSAVSDQDEAMQTTATQIFDDKKLKLIVRQQVKAEEKTSLTDDILIAAYRQHNSMRKAAEFLSTETGQTVTKDKIQRAVQRAGGVEAVASGIDSDSVRRTVASQRRDGKKKIQNRPEAMDWE